MPAFISSLLLAALSAAVPVQVMSFDPTAVASIRARHHDCPRCRLPHADLTNLCVKHGNLEGADFDGARLVLMCMSYGNYKGASFRGADLSGADLAHAHLYGDDLSGARLTITSIRSADLSRAKGLTQAQLNVACGDEETRLPAPMRMKTCP